MSPRQYKMKILGAVTRFYKKVPNSFVKDINKEAKDTENKMSISDKVQTV